MRRRAQPGFRPAILWLRLSTTRLDGSAEAGLLVGTTFIQRVVTQGGTAPPAAACNKQTVGKVVEVPYKADYFF